MSIKLYTTGCPKCMILEKKLDQKGVEYEKVEDFDVDFLVEKGFTMAPVLEVEGEMMGYGEAVKWIDQINQI